MHHLFALVICPFCSIFILFCWIHYRLYHLFTLSLFHLFLSHCSMPSHSCRLSIIVCTTSIHPSSTLYLLMPVLFYPITSILPLMPPLPRFLFLSPLFLLFSFLLVFLGTDLPNENRNGQDSKVSGELSSPFYPFHSSEKINTWVGHCHGLLGTLLAT